MYIYQCFLRKVYLSIIIYIIYRYHLVKIKIGLVFNFVTRILIIIYIVNNKGGVFNFLSIFKSKLLTYEIQNITCQFFFYFSIC